ncbi:putative AC transposase [Fusarium oxysporum f. sp. albedinis]|nr:putative AC transposase [Fusarium oxysporum f. sp. albedinis]
MQSSSRLQDACTPGLAAEKFLNLNTDEYSGACCSGHGLAGILWWWVPPLKFHAQPHGHGSREEHVGTTTLALASWRLERFQVQTIDPIGTVSVMQHCGPLPRGSGSSELPLFWGPS